jgi:acyl carrier protein
MSSQQVPSPLRDMIADILEVSPDEVIPEMGVETADNWDSFRHLQMILAIEEEYGVQFDPQTIPTLTTVALIQTELTAKGATL